MRPLRFLEQNGEPLYRVIRRGWKHPLDSSYSRTRDHRWNTSDFEALYCCTSKNVARAITMDVFRYAGVLLEDLRPEVRPQLVELSWHGKVIDVATVEGVRAAGFAERYPDGATRRLTQAAAKRWHNAELEGVVSRSASLFRLRFAEWKGDFRRWSEMTIFPANAAQAPKFVRRVTGLQWFTG